MVGRNDGIKGEYAGLCNTGCQIGADKDIIYSFCSSRVGQDIIVESVTVCDSVNKIVFDEKTVESFVIVSD